MGMPDRKQLWHTLVLLVETPGVSNVPYRR